MKNIIAITSLLVAGTALANAATIITFENTAHSYATDQWTIDGLGIGPDSGASASKTLTDSVSASLEWTAGKFGNQTISGTWANDTALADMNRVLGTNISGSDLMNTGIEATKASGSHSTLTFDFSSVAIYTTGTEMAFYFLVATSNEGGNKAKYNNFTVTGLDDCVISWAKVTEDATFSSATTVSVDNSTFAFIKVTGSLTENQSVSFDSTSGKNGWAMAAYSSIPEPSAFGLLAGSGALALVAARRRRKHA